MQNPLTLLPILAVLTGMIGLTGCGGCADGGVLDDDLRDASSPAPTGHGAVSVAWSLRDLGGQPIQCDQISARTVLLALHAQGQAVGTATSFECNTSPSTTKALLPGAYSASFELYADSTELATVPDQTGVVVKDKMTTVLNPITFVVDAQGSLVLTLAATTLSNCKSPLMLGAGINGITITLVQANGGCAPVTFAHTKGIVTLKPYTVSCSSPPVTACIENDETLTAPSLASGSYTIHIRGKIGAIECWNSDATLQVPARGMTLAQKINLEFQASNALCH